MFAVLPSQTVSGPLVQVHHDGYIRKVTLLPASVRSAGYAHIDYYVHQVCYKGNWQPLYFRNGYYIIQGE